MWISIYLSFYLQNTVLSFLAFEFAFKGTKAIDRSDVYYTISDLDHPVSALMQSPFKIGRGIATMIGLSKKVVRCMIPNTKVWFVIFFPFRLTEHLWDQNFVKPNLHPLSTSTTLLTQSLIVKSWSHRTIYLALLMSFMGLLMVRTFK